MSYLLVRYLRLLPDCVKGTFLLFKIEENVSFTSIQFLSTQLFNVMLINYNHKNISEILETRVPRIVRTRKHQKVTESISSTNYYGQLTYLLYIVFDVETQSLVVSLSHF